jgi:hypothetical protein
LEVEIPEAVSVPFSLEDLLGASVDDYGFFGEGCYAAMITEYTDRDEGVVSKISEDVCAAGFRWEVWEVESASVG